MLPFGLKDTVSVTRDSLVILSLSLLELEPFERCRHGGKYGTEYNFRARFFFQVFNCPGKLIRSEPKSPIRLEQCSVFETALLSSRTVIKLLF